ncbi:MAG TPA: histidine kinase [Gemmatimonadales bacterium]|nr:histidine kinase [Gemmatimonadales bacterium]
MTATTKPSDFRRMLLASIALTLTLGVLETLQQIAWASLREVPNPVRTTAFSASAPWFLLLPFLPGLIHLAQRWPLGEGRWARHLPLHLAASALLLLAHQTLWVLLAMWYDPNPATKLGPFLLKMVTVRMPVDMLVYWAVVGGVHAARASTEAREREQAAVRLEASLAEARLAALREQLQPHFLFNSLNAVSTLALRGDGQAVTQALSTLSDLLRMTLDTRAPELPLAEELAFLDRYLELQQLRFGDRLTVVRRIDDDALDAAVPAMLLQPLVENALRHGVEREPGAGRVEIEIRRQGGGLLLTVRDSGPGFRRVQGIREGIGLGNTRARLAALYGAQAWLECGDVPGGGGETRITLPYRPLAVATPAPLALEPR